MAVAFIAGTSNSGASISTLSVNVPAGVVNGNLLLFSASCDALDSLATPSGWTLVLNDATGAPNGQKLYVFSRVASSEPSSYNVATSGGGNTNLTATMVAYSGVDTASSNGVSNSASNSGSGVPTIDFPAITAASASDYLVYFGDSRTAVAYNPVSGTTERVEVISATHVQIVDDVQLSSTSVSAASASRTTGTANGKYVGIAVTLTTLVQATPSSVDEILAAQAPTVTASANTTTSSVDEILATQAASITAGADVPTAPVDEILATQAPSITASGSVTPASVDAVLSPQAPAPAGDTAQGATAIVEVLNPEAPTITASGAASPAEVATVLNPEAPTPVVGQSVFPDEVPLALAVQAPSINFDTQASASVVAEVLVAESATVVSDTAVTPAEAQILLTARAPSLTFSGSTTPTEAQIALAAQAPSITFDNQATVTPVAEVLNPESATVVSDTTVSVVAVSFTFIAETAIGAIAVTATAVAVVLSPQSPTINVSQDVLAAEVVFTLEIPSITLTGAQIAPDRTHYPVPPDDFITELLGPLTVITRRAVIYESDGATIWMNDAPILGGSVSVDASRAERRTLNVTFDNEDGTLDNYPGGFWYDKVIKVWRGIQLGEEFWETQLGEFCIDQIESPHFPLQCTVTGRDYTKRCLVSKLRTATSFAEGQTIEDVIEILATNAGITKFLLPNTGNAMGRQFLFDPGTTRWDAMNQIATAFGYELYFNSYGYLVMREYQDPVTSPQQWTFQTGAQGSIASYNRTANDTRIYNHIVVRGESSDTPPVWAESINNMPGSPTRVGGDGLPGGIGDRVYEYVSSFFTTTEQCQDVADKFLAIHALESFEVNIESLVLAWLDVNNIIEFIDPNPNPLDPTRFLLSSFEVPLGLGTMTSNAKRVTVVG